jgi:hypothetical protein
MGEGENEQHKTGIEEVFYLGSVER